MYNVILWAVLSLSIMCGLGAMTLWIFDLNDILVERLTIASLLLAVGVVIGGTGENERTK